MTTSNYRETLNLKHEPSRFSSLELATSYSNRTVKSSMIVLGCDNRFWVVCLADATRLLKMGYEYAR